MIAPFTAMLLHLSANSATAPYCHADLEPDSYCWIHATEVKPTQISYGKIEAEKRASKIAGMSEAQRNEYLNEHIAPLVVGPDRNFYLTDRHHLAKSLNQALGEEAFLFARIVSEHKQADEDTFWQHLHDEGITWLFDENGFGPVTIDDLPGTIETLKDDPFRSLAWGVRKADGFEKSDVSHADFLWANFFRSYINQNLITEDFDAAVDAGLALAQSDLAAHLPGYRERKGRHAPQ